MTQLLGEESPVVTEYGSFAKCQERFEAGEIIVYGRSDLLCIDLDSKKEAAEFHRRLVFFEEIYGQLDQFDVVSPSGRGWHVYIRIPAWLRPQTIAQRIAMQAILGSDPKREALSLQFTELHDYADNREDFHTNPIFLFEKDPTAYPDWVISKESVRRQRIEQIKLMAEKCGVTVEITGQIA